MEFKRSFKSFSHFFLVECESCFRAWERLRELIPLENTGPFKSSHNETMAFSRIVLKSECCIRYRSFISLINWNMCFAQPGRARSRAWSHVTGRRREKLKVSGCEINRRHVFNEQNKQQRQRHDTAALHQYSALLQQPATQHTSKTGGGGNETGNEEAWNHVQ